VNDRISTPGRNGADSTSSVLARLSVASNLNYDDRYKLLIPPNQNWRPGQPSLRARRASARRAELE
jgi:hypothetical protein